MKKYLGQFKELRNIIQSIGYSGEWKDISHGKQFRSNNGAILNWYSNKGNFQFQGNKEDKDKLRALLEAKLDESTYINSEQPSISKYKEQLITTISKYKEQLIIFISLFLLASTVIVIFYLFIGNIDYLPYFLPLPLIIGIFYYFAFFDFDKRFYIALLATFWIFITEAVLFNSIVYFEAIKYFLVNFHRLKLGVLPITITILTSLAVCYILTRFLFDEFEGEREESLSRRSKLSSRYDWFYLTSNYSRGAFNRRATIEETGEWKEPMSGLKKLILLNAFLLLIAFTLSKFNILVQLNVWVQLVLIYTIILIIISIPYLIKHLIIYVFRIDVKGLIIFSALSLVLSGLTIFQLPKLKDYIQVKFHLNYYLLDAFVGMNVWVQLSIVYVMIYLIVNVPHIIQSMIKYLTGISFYSLGYKYDEYRAFKKKL